MKTTCPVCMHHCLLEEGRWGLCHARKNEGGSIICGNYGQLTSLFLDPIEKKPLRHFFPGSNILSVGSFGCNLHCAFCQNASISTADIETAESVYVSPERLVKRAVDCRDQGNIGVAFTYNEPLISYEYVRDTAILLHKEGLQAVAVTNGSVTDVVLQELLPHLDAMNIDLKGFTNQFYRFVGGDLETVKHCIQAAAPLCHIELTTLILPGKNDSDAEMDALAAWVASIRPDIPLHVSRFFPRHNMSHSLPTPVERVYALAEVARRHLQYVYTGNC